MVLTTRMMLCGAAIGVGCATIAYWILPVGSAIFGVIGLAMTGLLFGAAFFLPGRMPRTPESDEIADLAEARLRELVRGTSMHLREMRYRYSVRMDPTSRRNHPAFTENVNSVRLGFVPVVLTDNETERQGLGYVAFVYDGQRWRGPGLPCPEDREEALTHARRCVTPLEPST